MVNPNDTAEDESQNATQKLKPINIRLRDLASKGSLELTPRRYQTELCERALKENVIICIGTGLGKTFITVLYLNSPEISELIHTHNKRIVFLAPTQDLVQQQADYINKQVIYQAKVYCGRTSLLGEHIDHWDRPIWDAELEKIQVLFMTPQIFASAISTSLLDWTKFAAIIFDECHHGCKSEKKKKESGHPYAQILRSYHAYYSLRRHESRPRIIGLSASLINTFPKTCVDILSQINRVESAFSATCVTDFEAQEAKPDMIINDYDSLKIDEDNDQLLSVLARIEREINNILKPIVKEALDVRNGDITAFRKRLKLASMGYAVRLPSAGKIFKTLTLIRKCVGLWGLRESCQYLLGTFQRPETSFNIPEQTKAIYNDLGQIVTIFHDLVDDFLKQQGPREALMSATRSQPKALLQILKDEYQRAQESDDLTFSCLVFVRSRLEARSLCLWLQNVSEMFLEYNFIKCQFTVGLARTKGTFSRLTKSNTVLQTQKLNDFRAGNLNVIVTTPVLEEGIDLPICSTVIRYTEAKTYREYVQSRGRARQSKSSYITMCESDLKQLTTINLSRFNDFESSLRLALTKYNIGPELRRKYVASKAAERRAGIESNPDVDKSLFEDDFFLANNNSIRICSSTARTILHMYCQGLSKNRPFTEKVQFGRNQISWDKYQTTLYLPPSCPISAQGLVGRMKGSPELADDSAIVAAIKALYDAKELDSRYCIPIRFSERNIDNLLQRHGLEPKYLELDGCSKGIVRLEGEKEVSYYEPKLFEPKNCNLLRNYRQRSYKLIKINFIPQANFCRRDTQRFFEGTVFGLIVDSTTEDDFIPSELFSHYGRFEVKHEIISDVLKLSLQTHEDCFYFTHKIMTRCLSIKGLKAKDLEYNCLFYLVLLDNSNQPNIPKMKSSFYGTYKSIRVGDIVKIRSFFGSQRQDRSANRRLDDDKLMVVEAIHTHMNASSLIPRCRSRVTFREDAEYKYGPNIVTRNDQAVIEVKPVSKDFAQTCAGKRAKGDYSTESIYYLEQFLEYFHDQPSHIFQAFNMPAIIYKLYLLANAAELDRRFYNDTQERRQIVQVAKNIELAGGDRQETDILPGIDKLKDGDERDPIDLGDIASDHSESYSHSSTDSDPDLDSSTDFDSDSDTNDLLDEQQAQEYSRRVHQSQISQQNNSLNIYSTGNNSSYKHRSFSDPTIQLEAEAASDERFRNLRNLIEEPLTSLSRKLVEFKCEDPEILLADDEEVLEKRNSKIDRSVVPPFSLDRGAKPVRQGRSRASTVLEALTLCRAQESYNLEELENVGDSYLKYVVSVVLHKKLTDVNEGLMTLARSRLTCNKYFAHLAKREKLGPYAVTRGFSKDTLAQALGRKVISNDFELKKKLSFSKMRPKDLADIFESIIGSYLLYHGEYEAISVIGWLKLNLFHDQDIFDELHEDAVVFSRVPSPLIQSDYCQDLCRQYKGRIQKFETVLGYNFNEPSFLIQAFTHVTFKSKCTPSYERLEFLGDSILDYLVTQTLLASTPDRQHWTPGQLTSSRSALVNNTAFARLAISHSYDLFVLHESQEIHTELGKMRVALDDDVKMDFFDMVDFDNVVKLLADLFEAVAGAIYLDSGCSLDTVWSIYYPMMKNSIEHEIASPTKNPFVLLYETYPGKDRIKFERINFNQGTDSSLVGVRCFIDGFKKPFEGSGLNLHQAKMRAVMAVLEVSDEDRNKCQEIYGKRNPGSRPKPPDRRPFVRRDVRKFRRHNVSNRRY